MMGRHLGMALWSPRQSWVQDPEFLPSQVLSQGIPEGCAPKHLEMRGQRKY